MTTLAPPARAEPGREFRATLGLGRAFALTGVLAILAAAVLAAVLPTVLPRTPRT